MFLKSLNKQKAIDLCIGLQNNPNVSARITIADIFKHTDLINIATVCVAEDRQIELTDNCRFFGVDIEFS